MKIMIIGDGKIGSVLAEQLSREKHEVTLVDRSGVRLDQSNNELDVMVVEGDGASRDVQLEAGADQADLVIACTGADELNLLCCLIGKKLGARHTFARGHVEILKTGVAAGSPLDGMVLKDIGKFRANVLICAVERGELDVIIPSGEFQLKAGDRISVVASPQEAQRFFRQVGVAKTRVRQVMLIGGGRMGYYLARQLLATGMDVKIIETNAKRCEELSQLLPEATILHGDGTDQRLLLEEGIEHMDAIAALTGIDEENIIISLFAGRTTRAKVITKVNRSSYEPLVASLSLDSVFYPRNICADNVVRYVRAMQNSDAYASMETLCKIVSNKVEAMEFRVTASADFCGIPLQDLHTKDGLLIGCISRGGKTITPRGSDTIEVGDSVIVVTTHGGLRSLNDIFRR